MNTNYEDNNHLTLVGKVTSDKRFSHEIYGEKFYIFDLSVPRLSGNADVIPVTISERLLTTQDVFIGAKLQIDGQFRSYNSYDNEKNKLILTVFVKDVQFLEENQEEEEEVRRDVVSNEVVLDGSTGEAFINPEASVVEEYKAKKAKFLEEKAALQKFVGQKSQTADGHVVELVANIGGPDEAEGVLERDGEGVGLFRSEFLFMESDAIPSEEAQFEAYKKVAETLDGKPVIIRTLDIGGDKALPYLGLPTEENPFLGFRAVRFC